jgi:hypothetical protein
MATFNLQDYETVEERIKRFYTDHAKGRIITDLIEHNIDKGMWVCKSYIFLSDADIDPVATGLAFEIDGQGMANKTSALENAETSAIGRALANAGYSGNKRASREEMQKVQRATAPKAPAITEGDQTWLQKVEALKTVDEAREMYKDAQKSASKKVLDAITLKADTLK